MSYYDEPEYWERYHLKSLDHGELVERVIRAEATLRKIGLMCSSSHEAVNIPKYPVQDLVKEYFDGQ